MKSEGSSVFYPSWFQQVVDASKEGTIFFLGIGGGYDVYASIPYLFELRMQNPSANVILGNLSFAYDLDKKKKKKNGSPVYGVHEDLCIEVRSSDWSDDHPFTEKNQFPDNYFPEFLISRWLWDHHKLDIPCFAFNLRGSKNVPKLGVENYSAALRDVVKKNNVRCVVLVDAGVDSVLLGDEEGVGTYEEDLLSMLACREALKEDKILSFLVCVGLSTEAFVKNEDFFRNWSSLLMQGACLGCVGWNVHHSFSVAQYVACVQSCNATNTTINSAIVASIQGHHGQYCPPCLYARGLRDHDMQLTPLTTLAWTFDFQSVMRYRMFVEPCSKAQSLDELRKIFEKERIKAGWVEELTGKYIGPRKYRN